MIKNIRTIVLSIIFIVCLHAAHAQWMPMNLPTNFSTEALAANNGVTYAVSDGNIYISTNNGLRWDLLDGGNVPTSVTCLILSGNDMFAGTWLNNGIFHSSDNGATWAAIDSGIPAPAGLDVYAIGLSGNALLAGTDHGYFMSSNRGGTWGLSKPGFYPASFVVSGNAILAGTYQNGAFRSTDNGVTWDSIDNGITGAYDIKQINALAINGNSIYAGAFEGMYVTTNNGDNWTPINSGLPVSPSYPNVTAVAAFGSTVMAGTNNVGIYASTNNGAHWAKADTGLGSSRMYSLIAINGTAYAGTDSGLFISEDNGAHWLPRNADMANLYYETLTANDSVVLGGIGSQGITEAYRSTDNGGTWVASGKGLSKNGVQCFLMRDTDIFLGEYPGTVLRSTDNGRSWVRKGSIPNDNITALLSIGKYFLGGASEYSLYRSTNDGVSWSRSDSGLPVNIGVSVLLALGGDVFADTYYGGMYRSTDSGATWKHVPITSGPNPGSSDLITFDGKLFSAGNGVFVSTDSGGSWSNVNTGMTGVTVAKLMPKGNYLFAATSGGVFLTGDDGAHWSNVSTGLSDLYVYALAVTTTDIYAGTHKSIWRRSLSDFSVNAVDEKPATVPQEIQLSQNYPNPFSAITTISYSLPESQVATLKVYNSLGEEVATLMNGSQSAGAHAVSLSAYDLQNGIYFYRLTAGKFSQSGKMVILH
jgi:hypothetical protein